MSVKISSLALEECDLWDDFVAAQPNSSVYHQSVWRGLIERTFGKRTHYLVARRADEISGVLPLVRLQSLMFGDFLVSLPYVSYGGILAIDDDIKSKLLSAAEELGKQLGVEYVELRHTEQLADWPVRTDKVSMHLRLTGSCESLWKQLGSKRRAQIKRPLREGIECQIGGAELVNEFYGVLSRKYRDLGIPVYPMSWFENVLRAFPDKAHVFLSTLSGKPVAAGITLGYRKSLEVPWAASARAADRLGVNMFLYWRMLEFAEQNAYEVFDFGRCTQGSGTWRFKKQWGAEEAPLFWHYWLSNSGELPILNATNPKYDKAISLWRRLPLCVTNTLGPQIVKNLP